jgi:predicted nuclease of predicted toxin-antitoxin system
VKLLCDENIARTVVHALRAEGFDITWIAEFARSVDDAAVLKIASAEARLLITADQDFGDHVFRQKANRAGVFLLRLGGMPDVEKGARVVRVLRNHGKEMIGKFSVMSPTKLRIRDI